MWIGAFNKNITKDNIPDLTIYEKHKLKEVLSQVLNRQIQYMVTLSEEDLRLIDEAVELQQALLQSMPEEDE